MTAFYVFLCGFFASLRLCERFFVYGGFIEKADSPNGAGP